MTPRRSAIWKRTLPLFYAVLGALDPIIRRRWAGAGIGITSRLTVPGRRTGRERSVLLGLISVDGHWYVGHPNGEVAWTSNLRVAQRARIAPRPGQDVEVVAVPLEPGPERDAVILATSAQQPFPANLLYRAARRHILSEGRYFRLDPA